MHADAFAHRPSAPLLAHPRLSGYFAYFPDDGLPDLDAYVACGTRFVDADVIGLLREHLPTLREKIAEIRFESAPLAARLELLALFFRAGADTPGGLRTPEFRDCFAATAFALAYTLAGADLIPDGLPEIGYADDAAVVEAVLTHHRAIFAVVAHEASLPWGTLDPCGEHAETVHAGVRARFFVP